METFHPRDTILPHTIELLPGVTLTVCPTDRFKVGMFSIVLPLSLNREAAPLRSLLFSVLRRGCRDYPTLSRINRRLDELYATPYRLINAAMGGVHCVGFGAELLENRYLLDETDLCGEVLSLMAKMLFEPCRDEQGHLLATYVEAEKKNTIDAIRSMKNHPASEAMAEFCDLFYEAEPYGHLLCGTEDEVSLITAKQLSELQEALLNHSPIECFYVGGLDETVLADRLRAVLKPYLDRPKRRLSSICPMSTVPTPWPEPRCIRVQSDAGQSHLLLGFRSGVTLKSPDFYAMMLCHELLGLSPISRLFVHVREAEGLCYSCTSEYHIERGDLIVHAGISAQNRERAERAILAQIQALQCGDFTEAEWQAARTSLSGGYRQLVDSTRGISRFYQLRARLRIDQTIEQCRDSFAKVTKEEVMEVARKLSLQLIYYKEGVGDCSFQEDDTDE